MKNNILLSSISLEELENRLVNRLKSELSNQEHPKPSQEEDFLTVKETAKLLGVSTVTLLRWRKEGLIKYYRFNSRIRFKKSDILNCDKSGLKSK